jgi:hypothetical protein
MSSGSGSHLPDWKDSEAFTCTMAPDPASLQGRALVCHISYNSGSYLPAGEGSRAPHVLRLQILPPYREGLVPPPHALWFLVDCGPQA